MAPSPKPNFLIIGAQKAGSTWLWKQLRRHPDVFVPPKKEQEYFSYLKNLGDAAWRDYLKLFESSEQTPWRGESTPSYFISCHEKDDWRPTMSGFNPHIARTVYERLGAGVLLIVSLRDPVDRAVSAFFHHVRRGRIAADQSIWEVGRDGGIIAAGFYARSFSEWLGFFPADNFFVCDLGQIKRKPAALLKRLYGHMGIEPRPAEDEKAREPANAGLVLERSETGIRALDLGDRSPVITPEDIEKLRSLYADDQAELRELLPSLGALQDQSEP